MFAPYADSYINLRTDRVSAEDADRQSRTAEEILRRLSDQPGIILADEVGMGKTFVALAVAVSVILSRPGAAPVVVMVPPTLKEKWPKDWQVFKQKCLPETLPPDIQDIQYEIADSGLEFLRILDNPTSSRKHLIFLTHGALHRGLKDRLVHLAIIRRALKGRRNIDAQRRSLSRFAGKLLMLDHSFEKRSPGILAKLLETPTGRWLGVLHKAHPDFRSMYSDDPVPRHMTDILNDLRSDQLDALVQALAAIPLRSSPNLDARLTAARQALRPLVGDIWRYALQHAQFVSPLLILDEAHHLKNPKTRLASLFASVEAAEDAELVEATGELGGKFERMLFLTATPFQLGHSELIRVLERFEGICWNGANAPSLLRPQYHHEIKEIATALDDAQAAALRLDRAWGRLTAEHLVDPVGNALDVDTWWSGTPDSQAGSIRQQLAEYVDATRGAVRAAEARLKPWVLRHLKSRHLPAAPDRDRRQVLPGAAILDPSRCATGLEIQGDALFPFLLAGRAQAIVAASARGRALFAEGLASSFEAYRETRSTMDPADEDPDAMTAHGAEAEDNPELSWYLRHLDEALPRGERSTWASHPKVGATVERVAALWKAGEKALVFCHYRATGRALREHISARIDAEIIQMAAAQLPGVPAESLREEIDRIGERFFDVGGTLRTHVDDALERIVRQFGNLAGSERDRIIDVVRRFLRTPSFLVRYFDLSSEDRALAFSAAIDRPDMGGLSLRGKIEDFCGFLANRCIPEERKAYLDALDSIQTGSRYVRGESGAEIDDLPESGVDGARLLANVRLANGLVKAEARRKLLLAFNTPLFPEVLIASSVLAEGVDLHLDCRYIIHHDLCWNPSTLEQRTGRVDRLGSKAEKTKASIFVYLPYVAATQDEKMYRVVRDRERWFQIVMGEKYEVDEVSTDRHANRVPLPETLQRELTLNLQV